MMARKTERKYEVEFVEDPAFCFDRLAAMIAQKIRTGEIDINKHFTSKEQKETKGSVSA